MQLDSGEAFKLKLKPANARTEGTGGANGEGKTKKRVSSRRAGGWAKLGISD